MTGSDGCSPEERGMTNDYTSAELFHKLLTAEGEQLSYDLELAKACIQLATMSDDRKTAKELRKIRRKLLFRWLKWHIGL